MSPTLSTLKHLAATLLLVCTATAAYAESVGNVIRATGVVNAIDAAGKTRALAAGDVINVGDVVSSSEKSSVQLQMKDAAIIALTANSELKIGQYRFQEKGATAPDKIDLILQKGRLRTITGLAKKSGYLMTTHIGATVNVEGTLYDVLTLADGSMAIVLREGAIRVTSGGVSVLLDVPGTMVRIPGKGKPPSAPEQAIPAEDLDLILAITETGPTNPIDPSDPEIKLPSP